MEARFEHIKENVGNPWLSASNGYTGLDFILWTISTSPSKHVSSCTALADPGEPLLISRHPLGYTTQTIAAGLACFW